MCIFCQFSHDLLSGVLLGLMPFYLKKERKGSSLHLLPELVLCSLLGQAYEVIFRRPVQSQGLLYEHLRHSITNSLTDGSWKYLYGAATP